MQVRSVVESSGICENADMCGGNLKLVLCLEVGAQKVWLCLCCWEGYVKKIRGDIKVGGSDSWGVEDPDGNVCIGLGGNDG